MAVGVGLGRLGVWLRVGVVDIRADALENERLADAVKVWVGMRVRECDRVVLVDAVGVVVTVTEWVRLAVADTDRLGEGDGDALRLRDPERVSVAEAEPLGEC